MGLGVELGDLTLPDQTDQNFERAEDDEYCAKKCQ
jgi:hypothetical protein